MNRMHCLIAGAFAAATMTVTSPALAQSSNGNPMGRGNHGMGVASGRAGASNGAVSSTQALLDVLHTRLAITSGQESAWRAFASAAVAQAADVDATPAQIRASGGTSADMLNFAAATLKHQSDDAALVAQTYGALYSLLTASQRAIADAHFAHGLPF